MASYEVRWKQSAERDLRRLDPSRVPRIVRAVDLLADDPFPRESRKLQGTEKQYRLRIGDYRIIYQVDVSAKIIVVFHVRHRRGSIPVADVSLSDFPLLSPFTRPNSSAERSLASNVDQRASLDQAVRFGAVQARGNLGYGFGKHDL